MTYRVQASGTSHAPSMVPAPDEWISSTYRLRTQWPTAAETAARQLLMSQCSSEQRVLDAPRVRIAGIEP